MFETCTKDSDCVDNQVCFIANQSWSNQTMCYCNTYYGFSGPDCSITLTEPNSIFLVVIGTICIVVCAVFLVISAGNLLLLWRAIPKDRRKKTVLTDSVLATTVYLTFGALLLIPYGSLLIVVALRPFDPTVSDDESLMYLEFIAQNCLTIAMMFLASGVMTIALGFVEMTMNLAPAKRKAVQVFGAVYKLAFFITVVSLVAVRKVYLAFIASFPFVIILAGAYIAGLMLLTRKIKKHREQNDKALESLRSVQKTVLLLCLCLVAEIALSAVFSFTSLLTGWRVLSPPGHLTVSLLGHLTWFPSVLGCLAVLRDITTWRMVRERQYARAMGATTSTPSIDRRGIGFGHIDSLPPPVAVSSPGGPATTMGGNWIRDAESAPGGAASSSSASNTSSKTQPLGNKSSSAEVQSNALAAGKDSSSGGANREPPSQGQILEMAVV